MTNELVKNRMRALTDDEKEMVIKTVSNEMLVRELERRLKLMTNRINQLKEIFKVQEVEE